MDEPGGVAQGPLAELARRREMMISALGEVIADNEVPPHLPQEWATDQVFLALRVEPDGTMTTAPIEVLDMAVVVDGELFQHRVPLAAVGSGDLARSPQGGRQERRRRDRRCHPPLTAICRRHPRRRPRSLIESDSTGGWRCGAQ